MDSLYILYLVVLAFGTASALTRYRYLDTASRILLVWLGVTFFIETAAYYAAIVYRHNAGVYAIGNIVQAILLCVFFQYSIPGQGKRTGYVWAAVSLAAGAVNLRYVQPAGQLGTYFLVFTGLLVTGYCLFGFSRLLSSPFISRLAAYPHFWFMTILAAFWLVMLLNWTCYNYFSAHYTAHAKYLNLLIILANIIAYASIGTVFLLYPKMIRRYYGR